MADITKEDVIEFISNMTVLELSEFIKELEDKFGVSAAAPVAVAGMPMGGGDAGGAAAGAPVQVLHHFTPPEGPEATYWGVVLAGSARPRAARAYLDVLTGPAGQAAFRRAGFDVAGSPP